MSKKLDKSRPFGAIHPPYKGAFFEQDGYFFDHEGNVVAELLTPAQKAKLSAPAKPKPPEPAAKTGGDKPPVTGESDDKEEDGSEGGESNPNEVNLESWLKEGDKSQPFRVIQVAVKERYNKWCTSRVDLVTFLVVENKLIDAQEVAEDLKQYVVA